MAAPWRRSTKHAACRRADPQSHATTLQTGEIDSRKSPEMNCLYRQPSGGPQRACMETTALNSTAEDVSLKSATRDDNSNSPKALEPSSALRFSPLCGNMALFSSNSSSSLGSLNLPTYFRLPVLPTIIAEWAAILPLVCHLASYRQDYHTAGEVALLKRIRLSLLPKLGRLEGLGRLLRSGTTFVDQASARGGATKTVWDVKWGSVFPCVNGAASDVLVECFISSEVAMPLRMPEKTSSNDQNDHHDPRGGAKEAARVITPKGSQHRRHQILNILRLGFNRVPPKKRILKRYWNIFKACGVPFVLIGLIVVLALCGAYGTSALMLCTLICSNAALLTTLERPPGYLQSNEASDEACMLLAPHGNAQEWTLLIGERGIIDTLLNKPMIHVPRSRTNQAVAACFWGAHLAQLIAMTFVAAQKGWDGVLLLAIMILDSLLMLRYRRAALAAQWASESNVTSDTRTFLFGSRTVMIGVIEVLWGTGRTLWMDDILVPHPRRDLWLSDILGQEDPQSESLSPFDKAWARKSADLVRLSAKEIESIMVRECRAANKIAD